MKKLLKIAAVVAVVLLAAALVVPMAFKGKVAQIVKREANAMLRARLDFEKIDVSLLRHFPHASLELKGLTLVGEDRFAGDTIASVERISVVVDVLSLFGDKGFEVTKLFVTHPMLNARKLADGAVNWDVLRTEETSEESAAAPEQSASEPSSFRLSVRDVHITDAEVRYCDDSTGMRFAAAPASLRLRGDMSAAQTDLDLNLLVEDISVASGGVALLRGAEAELQAAVSADLERQRFTFSENTLRLNAIELALDGWVEMPGQTVKMDIKAGCEKVGFKEILSLIPAFYTRQFSSLSASGDLTMALWARGELSESTLPAFELKLGVADGSFQYASLPKAVTRINIAARVANPGGVMDKTEVELSKFGFEMGGNSLSATLQATNLMSDPSFRAAASGRVDLGMIKEVYPLDEQVKLGGHILADVKVSGRMSDIESQRYEQIGASGTFVIEGFDAQVKGLPAVHIRRAAATITPSTMTLGECGVKIGKSDVAANGQLTGYIGYFLRGEMLSGRLYVKSELLDMNEMMAAMPAEGAEMASEPTEEPTVEAVGALEVPRNLNLSLCTDLHKILFQQMTLTEVSGEMRISDATLSLDKLRIGIFGGTATASGSYSTAVDVAHPALRLSASVAGASFARTFEELETVQKLVPLFAKTGGDYGLTLDLSTTLDARMEPDLTTLNATGEIKSANIRVQQIAAFDALAKALKNDALRNIEARDVAIHFAIRDGRIYTEPFDLRMGGITVNLSGSTGLDQSIDYAARVALPEAMTGGLLSSVGVTIGGTFSDPKITLGAKEVVDQAVRNVIDQQLGRLTGGNTLSEEVKKQTERLREEAVRAGEKLVAAAEAQRTKLVEAAKNQLAKIAAEKVGDKLVAEARNQADKLVAEAERQIEKLKAKQE